MSNGCSRVFGTHLSVFVQMLPDNKSNSMSPFSGTITFVIIDQTGAIGHKCKTIKALPVNPSFQTPVMIGGNPPNGISKLICLEELSGNGERYQRDNKLIIGVCARYNPSVVA